MTPQKATTLIETFDNQNNDHQLFANNIPITSVMSFIEGKDFKNGITITQIDNYHLNITCFGQSKTYYFHITSQKRKV